MTSAWSRASQRAKSVSSAVQHVAVSGVFNILALLSLLSQKPSEHMFRAMPIRRAYFEPDNPPETRVHDELASSCGNISQAAGPSLRAPVPLRRQQPPAWQA